MICFFSSQYSFYNILCGKSDCAPLQQAQIDEGLPKKLVVVKFQSLTVAEGPQVKPQRMPDAGCDNNFKRFRKVSAQCCLGNKNMPQTALFAVTKWCCPALLCEHLGNYRTFICTRLNSIWILMSEHGHVRLLVVHGCIDWTADGSSRLTIELYRSMLSAHARPYVAKLRGELFTGVDDSCAAQIAPNHFTATKSQTFGKKAVKAPVKKKKKMHKQNYDPNSKFLTPPRDSTMSRV